MKIAKGDIVARISYNKDILFVVDRIITPSNIAILKGIDIRIEADAPLYDLKKMDRQIVKEFEKNFDYRLDTKIKQSNKKASFSIYTGKILHLDGDKRYREKSIRYYRKLGLNAIVKNIPEYNQPKMVQTLLNKYNPDILVVTGHDAMLKNGVNFNNIYNYRNSRHFIDTVKEARKWAYSSDKLTIFARCVSKLL